MGDFQLRINDIRHEIQLPDDQIARLLLVNEDNEVLFQDIFHVKHEFAYNFNSKGEKNLISG